jgi:mRNA interferase MazF
VRGDVYQLKAPRTPTGREQAGRRFAVIVQSDELPMSTVLVAPTSRSARPAEYRPAIEIGDEETRVLVEQMTCVDPTRLGERVGSVTYREMQEIEVAARLLLEL